MFSGLNNSVAIISGAAGGMGTASTLRLAKEGCKVFAVDMSQEALDRMMAKVAEEGLSELVYPYVCNATDEAEVNAAVDKCIELFGKVSILVNIAGIYTDCLFKDMTFDEWSHTMDININSVMFFCHAALPNMLENKYGKIINMASQAGVVGSVKHTHYSASKAAIIGMSRSLAREVAEDGINVNCIAPGIIKTPMTARYTPEQVDNFMSKIPMHRFGEADDVAKVIEFLASDGSDYLTGQIFNVTGGWLMLS